MEFDLDALQLLPIDETGLAQVGDEVCGVTCAYGSCHITLILAD